MAPIVYLDSRTRGAACAEALVLADRIGEELEVPVFLYGELAGADHGRGGPGRQLRRGGVAGLAERMAAGCADRTPASGPDFGPSRMHPTAGATLVAAREPLVAFNLQLAPPATVEDAGAIAALIREGGAEGLPGVRAIGVQLGGAVGAGLDEHRAPARGQPGRDGHRGGAKARPRGQRRAGRTGAARRARRVFPRTFRFRASTPLAT